MSATLLIADDDLTIRTVLSKALSRHGFNVRTTAHAATLWHWAAQGEGDLIITDVMMPDGNGLELVPSLKRLRPEVKIIVISAQNSLSTAVKTQELGVFGYLPKPFDLKELITLVEAALATNDQKKQRPSSSSEGNSNDFPLVGKSKVMTDLFRKMGKYATGTSPILISGGVGTGKSLAAKTLLATSNLAGEKITIASPEDFDRFMSANRTHLGVVLLENIDTLTRPRQLRLSQFMDESGDETPNMIITTASSNITSLVKSGECDRGLYDKLSVLQLKVPKLSERLEDIPSLIENFQRQLNTGLVFSPQLLEYLKIQAWPGNIRQLKNLVKRLGILGDQNKVNLQQVEEALEEQAANEQKAGWLKPESIEDIVKVWVDHQSKNLAKGTELHRQLVQLVEKPLIEKVMRETRNNQIKSSSILGLNRNTLRKKISELGIKLKK